MKADTKRALLKSILHWHRLATMTAGPEEKIYGNDCALCKKFHNLNNNKCYNCPVMEYTKEHMCRDTPWSHASSAFHSKGKNSPEFLQAATLMRDFLINLMTNEREKSSLMKRLGIETLTQ